MHKPAGPWRMQFDHLRNIGAAQVKARNRIVFAQRNTARPLIRKKLLILLGREIVEGTRAENVYALSAPI